MADGPAPFESALQEAHQRLRSAHQAALATLEAKREGTHHLIHLIHLNSKLKGFFFESACVLQL